MNGDRTFDKIRDELESLEPGFKTVKQLETYRLVNNTYEELKAALDKGVVWEHILNVYSKYLNFPITKDRLRKTFYIVEADIYRKKGKKPPDKRMGGLRTINTTPEDRLERRETKMRNRNETPNSSTLIIGAITSDGRLFQLEPARAGDHVGSDKYVVYEVISTGDLCPAEGLSYKGVIVPRISQLVTGKTEAIAFFREWAKANLFEIIGG